MKKIILSLIFCAVSFVVAFSQINITASTTAPEVQFVLSVDGVLQDGRNGTINTIYPGPQQWTTNKSLSFADEAAVMAWAQGYGITFDVEREICFRIRTRVRGCGSYCLSNWSPNARCFDFAAVLFTCDDCVEIALADVLTVGDSVFFNVCAVDETGLCVEVLNTYGIELPIHGVDTILLDAGIYAHVNVDGNAQLFGYTFLSPSSSVVTTVVPGPTPGTFQVQQDVDFSSIDVIVDCMDGVTSVGLAGIDTVQLPTPTLSHLNGELILGQCEEVLSSVPAEVGNIDDDFNFVVIGGDSICVPSCCYTQPYILPQFGVCPVIFPGDTNPKDSIIASGGDGYELANEAGIIIETVPTDGVIADYTFLLPRGIPEGVYTLTITGTPPVGCVTEIDFSLFNDCPLLLGGDLAGTGYTNVNGSYIADVNLPPGAEINNTVNTAQIITGIDTAYIAVQDVDDDCASVTVNDSTLLLAKCKDCCPPVDMTVQLATGEEVTDPADILQVQAYVAAYRALNPECQLSGLLFEFNDPGVQVCDWFFEGDNIPITRSLREIIIDGAVYNVDIPLGGATVISDIMNFFDSNSISYTSVNYNPVFPQRLEFNGVEALTLQFTLRNTSTGNPTFGTNDMIAVNCVLQPGGGTYIYEDVCGTVILTKEPAPEQVNEITIDTTNAKCITITDELDGKSAELQTCCPDNACDYNISNFSVLPNIGDVNTLWDSISNNTGCGISTDLYYINTVPGAIISEDELQILLEQGPPASAAKTTTPFISDTITLNAVLVGLDFGSFVVFRNHPTLDDIVCQVIDVIDPLNIVVSCEPDPGYGTIGLFKDLSTFISNNYDSSSEPGSYTFTVDSECSLYERLAPAIFVPNNNMQILTPDGQCIPTCDALDALADRICDDNSRPLSRINVRNASTLFVENTYFNQIDSIVYVPNQLGVFCGSAANTNAAIAAAFANPNAPQVIAGCTGGIDVTWLPIFNGLAFGNPTGLGDMSQYSGTFVSYSVNSCDPPQVVHEPAKFSAETVSAASTEICEFNSFNVTCRNDTVVIGLNGYGSDGLPEILGVELIPDSNTGEYNTGACNLAGLRNAIALATAQGNQTTWYPSGASCGIFVMHDGNPDGPDYGHLFFAGIDERNFAVELTGICNRLLPDNSPNPDAIETITSFHVSGEKCCCTGPNGETGQRVISANGTDYCQYIDDDGDVVTTLIP